MYDVLTNPTVEVAPEELLRHALAAGNPVEAAYHTGQLYGVADVTLPQYRTAWPRGTVYNVASTSKDPAISVLDAHDPNFYGGEATVYAQEALGMQSGLTKARLQDMAMDVRMNTPPARREARIMLDEFDGYAHRLQAEIASKRVGWAAIVDGHFVACPPNGNVLLGRTADAHELNAFLRDNGYTSLPLDNPYAQPVVDALARRSGVDAETIRARGLAHQRQVAAPQVIPEVGPLETAPADARPPIDATLIDFDGPLTAVIPAAVVAEPAGTGAEQGYQVMSSFAFAAAVGRLAGSGLYPQAADAVELTRAVMLRGDVSASLPQYSDEQREALTGALRAIAARPVMNPEARALHQEAVDALSVLAALAVRHDGI